MKGNSKECILDKWKIIPDSMCKIQKEKTIKFINLYLNLNKHWLYTQNNNKDVSLKKKKKRIKLSPNAQKQYIN